MAGYYSFGRVKIISRNGIKSSVATAAYHAAIKLTNEYDGLTHDHSRKKNVGETYIRMPESVPASWRDESIPAKERLGVIWNAVEQANPATNARLARSNYIALPHSLTLEQGLECVDRWIEENCTSKGMGVTYSVHNQPGNLHVDLLYLTSEYDKNGKPKARAKKEYLCRDKAGNERYMDAETLKNAKGYEKVYKYEKDGERADMTASEASEKDGWERINKYPVCRTVKVSGWDDKDLAKTWRKSWEVILNQKFEELNLDDRVDCRSYKERGMSQVPTIHEGWKSDKEEKHAYNENVIAFNQGLKALHKEGMNALDSTVEQIRDLRDNQQTEDSLDQHEEKYRINEYKLNSIADSGLFSTRISNAFRKELARLSRYFIEGIEKWRERIRQEIGADKKLIEADKADHAATSVRRTLSEMIEQASAEKSEQRPGKKQKSRNLDNPGNR